MSNWTFNRYYNKVNNVNKDDRKLTKAVNFIKNKNISANQTLKISKLFNEDHVRLAYVKRIYSKITDKSNAITICDAFSNFSYSQLLWEYIKEENKKLNINNSDIEQYVDYAKLKDKKKDKQTEQNQADKTNIASEETTKIKDNKQETTVNDKPQNNTVKENNNTNYEFPDASVYKGKTFCENPLNDKMFKAFYNSVLQMQDDGDKTKICMEYVDKYCFTCSQLMKLALLIKLENYRFVLLKTSYDKIYDKKNFSYTSQVLSSNTLKEEINKLSK